MSDNFTAVLIVLVSVCICALSFLAVKAEKRSFDLERYIERSKQAEIKCGCGNYTLTEHKIICIN